MKNKFLKITSYIAIVLTITLFNACDDTSETLAVTNGTAPTLADITISNINLDAVNTTTPALTLSWTNANYGQQAAINYAVQFATDEAFTNPYTATSIIGQNAATLSMGELNSAAGNAGLNPFEWGTLYARIVSSLGTQNSNQVTSNSINFKVYPYYNYVYNDYYLVGNGVASGWDNNANNVPLFRNTNNENEFTYTGYFAKGSATAGEGRFKVLETKGLWQPQWGTTYPDGSDPIETSGEIAGNPGTQSDDPGRFGVETAGYYKFTVNFASKKYSIEPFDASSATSLTSLALEGTSVAASTPLTALTFDGHIWYVNNIRLTPGEVKFVTNTGDTWGSNTSFSGTATNGGANIPVIVEDDYDVWFNDLTGEYMLIPLNL